MEYTREQLIKICEKAIVSQDKWNDRDSFSSQIGVGKCWALLKAGCKFKVLKSDDPQESISTDESTIWIQFWAKTFNWFEYGEDEDSPYGFDNDNGDKLLFYLPTEKRLQEVNGNDWY